MRAQTTIAAAVVALWITAAPAFAQELFYVRDFQNLWKANADGSGAVLLYTYPDFPIIDGIANDGENGRVYLATEQQGPGFNVNSIDRINTDGTGFLQIVNLGTQFPLAVTYNPADDKIYWLEQGASRSIRRANTDGTSPETVLTDADAAFRQVRVHLSDQQVWWSDGADPTISFAGTIRRAPVGTGVAQTTVWSGIGTNQLEGFDFSFSTGEVFMVVDSNTISKANIDGTGTVTTVASGSGVGSNLEDIVVDRTNNRIFWQDLGSDRIYSANLDGTAQTTVVDGGTGGFAVSNGLAISNPDLVPVELEALSVE